jgi:hypothetical protein
MPPFIAWSIAAITACERSKVAGLRENIVLLPFLFVCCLTQRRDLRGDGRQIAVAVGRNVFLDFLQQDDRVVDMDNRFGNQSRGGPAIRECV